MTNADRIRNMTDEQLANLLYLAEIGIIGVDKDYPCECCNVKTNCEKCWLEWLHSEVE